MKFNELREQNMNSDDEYESLLHQLESAEHRFRIVLRKLMNAVNQRHDIFSLLGSKEYRDKLRFRRDKLRDHIAELRSKIENIK